MYLRDYVKSYNVGHMYIAHLQIAHSAKFQHLSLHVLLSMQYRHYYLMILASRFSLIDYDTAYLLKGNGRVGLSEQWQISTEMENKSNFEREVCNTAVHVLRSTQSHAHTQYHLRSMILVHS